MVDIPALIERFNFQVPGGRWQLFEISDLELLPEVIRHLCQNTLTAQWTKRMPVLQQQAPAELAANAILEALNSLEDIDTADWTVIDFCSGAGGPVPAIETCVNHGRKLAGKKPIQFRLSDLHPNLNAWMEHAAHSEYLSFVPQSVDATNPPFSVISTMTAGDKEAASKAGYVSTGSKVFRLFCLSFHHFDDPTAIRVLKSTLETSDAFAIIELQDRRIGSLVIMLLEYWLLFLITVFWFWHDGVHLFLTYALPILPPIHSFDGLVSCLRTRSFEETVRLVESVKGERKSTLGTRGKDTAVHVDGWRLAHSRVLHTWPNGHMEVIFGRRLNEYSPANDMRVSAE